MAEVGSAWSIVPGLGASVLLVVGVVSSRGDMVWLYVVVVGPRLRRALCVGGVQWRVQPWRWAGAASAGSVVKTSVSLPLSLSISLVKVPGFKAHPMLSLSLFFSQA